MNENQMKTIMLSLMILTILTIAIFTIETKLNWNDMEELSKSCEYFKENTKICSVCYGEHKIEEVLWFNESTG